MIKLKPFRETPGLCGPASLKIVFDYYGFSVSEAKIARIAGATKEKGVSSRGLIKAARYFGFKTFSKKKSSLNELRYFIKRKIPVIVDWFSEDDGHYSVVADIDDKNIRILDPSYKKVRTFPIETFIRVWFDFPCKFIKNPRDLVLRLMLIVIPDKKCHNTAYSKHLTNLL